MDHGAVQDHLDRIVAADLEDGIETIRRRVLQVGQAVDDVIIYRVADILRQVVVDIAGIVGLG